ncbi:uncharacterized protein LOC119992000 [Tripterygium wilfordii]|nr:uncharacterized protein LOC119992000 [Tripterygium wilfordii]
MGCQNWHQKLQQNLTRIFHVLTITLLSLLLPLSFLLLARLSCVNYLLAATTTTTSKPSFLFSIILYTNPALLYLLISIITITTLIHGLTGKLTIHKDFSSSNDDLHQNYRPGLYTAWILICTLQVCVGLGIEGSIEAGIDGTSFGVERSLMSRIVFFLGLHETMMYWSRVVVKPVVDDAIYGAGVKEEKYWWVGRVGIGFGSLWWWRLRDEVESMVVVPEAKRELLMEVEVADFIGWWLYYLVVTVGMVRVVKGLMWVGVVVLCRRFRRNSGDEEQEEDGKV